MAESAIGKNIPALTGLRWIAAFLVLLRHNPPQRDSILYPAFSNGHSGVTLFFVLSGFVLTINYFDKFPRLNFEGIKDFYVARIARIYPLYLVVLIGYGVVFRFDELTVVAQHVFLVQAWSSNSDVSYAMNGPGWSLGVEAFFYLVFPLAIYFSRPMLLQKGRAEALLVLCLTGIFMAALAFELTDLGGLPENDPNSMWRWLYRNPVARLGDFFAGIALAAIYIKQGGCRAVRMIRVSGYISWFSLILALSCRGLIDNSFGVDFVFAVISCGLIFTSAVDRRSAISRFLSCGPLRVLGELSFAVYLVHVPIRQAIAVDFFGPGFTFGTVWKFLAYLVVVVGISAILHYSVERPARIVVRRAFRTRT